MTNTTYRMTVSQKAALNSFLDFAVLTDQHEVKELSIKDSYGDAYVSVTIGVKNDAGTMAEIICRDTYLFFIGRRGGIYQFTDACNKVYRRRYEVRSLGY